MMYLPFEAVQELDPELKNSLVSPIDWPHHLRERKYVTDLMQMDMLL